MDIIKSRNYDHKIFTNRRNTTYKESVKWDVIVEHITEGYMPGTLNWLTNIETDADGLYKAQVSCHFLVCRNGAIYQLVSLENGAWHCVKKSPTAKLVKDRSMPPNLYSVGIEHEGLHKDTNGALTPEQYKSSLEVHKYIIEEYERINKEPFPINRDHIIGHYEVDTINRDIKDPGVDFPWNNLLLDLKKWDISRKETKPVAGKKKLDVAQKWAVDNGIMRDEKWEEPATRWQIAWWLYMLGVWVTKQIKK